MKKISIIILALTLVAAPAAAEPQKEASAHSAEFEKLKSLDGKWKGTTTKDGKLEDITVTYHLTSGGTAVVETITPGTPHEMVSVYHDENGKLVMTHYCMLGNQPKLDVKKSSVSEIDLGFSNDNSIDPRSDHMNGVRFTFVDSDNVVQEWSGIHDGKAVPPTVFKLARVK